MGWKRIKKTINLSGISLIEALVSILVVSFLVLVFSSISFFLRISLVSRNTIHAYQLAQEEIESLKNMDFDKLTNRTGADFLNVAYNKGDFKIVNDGTSNVYDLSSGSGAGVTGRAITSGGDYENYILEMDIKALDDSPVNWQVGFYLRYQDKNNFYLLKFSNTDLFFSKTVEGTETILYSTSLTHSKDAWYTYKLEVNDNNFDIYRDLILYSNASDPDNAFTTGKIVLAGFDNVHAHFDNIKIDNALITNGDFEAGPLSKIADGWQRLGINDLPSGEDELTIESFGGDDDVKEITATIEWVEDVKNREVKLNTIISRYGIHKK